MSESSCSLWFLWVSEKHINYSLLCFWTYSSKWLMSLADVSTSEAFFVLKGALLTNLSFLPGDTRTSVELRPDNSLNRAIKQHWLSLSIEAALDPSRPLHWVLAISVSKWVQDHFWFWNCHSEPWNGVLGYLVHRGFLSLTQVINQRGFSMCFPCHASLHSMETFWNSMVKR